MEGGNYGYTDELTGAGWQTPRTNMEKEIPDRHWHQNDPGVVPNLLVTGSGSPSGICVYEGRLLPKPFHDQLLHCEPGHNVVRCYRVAKDGAGFKVTETLELLKGKRDNWFRPADVCVAPDGSVFVSDWYDPGVGGHAQGDTKRGRIFRVAPKEHRFTTPKLDFKSPAQIVEGLKSPCLATHYIAWTAYDALSGVAKLKTYASIDAQWKDLPSTHGARLAWFGFRKPDPASAEGQREVTMGERTLESSSSDLRALGWRAISRFLMSPSDFQDLGDGEQRGKEVEAASVAQKREMAVSLRSLEAERAVSLWTELAAKHDGKDRWYLEALGIGAANKWDACLDAWLAKVGDKWNTPAGRDIIWRSRAKKTPEYLAKIIADPSVPTDELPRYFRAFDFQKGQEAIAALVQLASADFDKDPPRQKLIDREVVTRLQVTNIKDHPRGMAMVDRAVAAASGTTLFVDLVHRYDVSMRFPDLLALAQQGPADQLGVRAMRALIAQGASRVISEGIAHQDPKIAIATIDALGNAADNRTAALLLPIVKDDKKHIELRKAAAKSLAKTHPGAEEILKMFKTKAIDAEVASGAAFVLNAAPWDNIRREAATLFPPPPSKDNRPLPPIDRLVERRGDANRGKQVFAKAGTCANCHKVAGEGKEVGPDLSEIGAKLSRQALFESILFPSAGISHSYETFSVSTNDGNILTGVLVNRTADEITIKDKDALLRTVKTSEVDEVKQQPVSLMPADLQKLMTVEELVDVVEYMTTLRKK
jgi:putative heme-binding domain-containing protein